MANVLFHKKELTIEEQQIRSSRKKKKMSDRIMPYLLLLPTFVFLGVFTFFPLARLIWLSFRKYNLLSVNEFIGLKNYHQLFFISRDFLPSLKNTLVYTLFSVVFLIILAVLLGLWLHKDRKINSLAKRIVFFPHIVAGVSISMIFAWLMNSRNGLFNQLLLGLGLSPLAWFDSSDTALGSVIAINVWKSVGYYTLIILAALGGISSEINEAATLDNTPAARRLFKITLPMISPQVFFMLVMVTISSFKVFDLVRLLTNGGPGTATNVLVLFIYRYAFEMNRQVGYACAAGVVLMFILLILTVVYFKLVEKRVHYQ